MARSLAVGLDIGTSAVRAAEIDLGKSPPVLTRFGQLLLPPGAVRDGEIEDPVLVGQKLRELWSRAGFKTKRVLVGVANQRVIVRQVEMPWLEEHDLEEGLAFQAQEHIPIPVEDAVLDFQIIDEVPGENGERMMRVIIVAGQRDMIHHHLEALEYAGLTPQTIDLVPFALLRCLAAGQQDDWLDDSGLADAIVDIGAGVTNIVVHERGIPRFVRILVAGGDDVTRALADGLDRTPEEAEAIKREAGFGVVAPDAKAIIDERSRTLLDEVRGSLDYYGAQPDAIRIGRVVVTGGGTRLPEIAERLGRALGLPAEAGHPLARIKLGKLGLVPDQLAEAETFMPVPVGLALGGAR